MVYNSTFLCTLRKFLIQGRYCARDKESNLRIVFTSSIPKFIGNTLKPIVCCKQLGIKCTVKSEQHMGSSVDGITSLITLYLYFTFFTTTAPKWPVLTKRRRLLKIVDYQYRTSLLPKNHLLKFHLKEIQLSSIL